MNNKLHTKLKSILNYILVFISLIVIWLLIDFIDVKVGRVPDFKYSLHLILFVVWLSFSWISKDLFELEGIKKHLAIFSLSFITTAIWFVVGVFLVINFHLLIGGSL